MEPIIAGEPDAQSGPVIKDTDTANFAKDVIEASQQVPVIVDFRAPWCGPCKQLGPVLEKVIQEQKGKARLVKLDIDKNQQIAAQMQVQSIPAVFAFLDGRPVDGFMGALPESEVRQFVEKIVRAAADGKGSPIADALERAKAALESGDAQEAAAFYNQVLQAEPDNVAAAAGVARCLVAMGDGERARLVLDGLDDEAAKDPDVAAARTALDLLEQSEAAGDTGELEAAVAADPNNHQARIDLAAALFGAKDPEGAIKQLIESIRIKRDWNDEAARTQLLKYFEALGHGHPATIEGRRRLSAILFS